MEDYQDTFHESYRRIDIDQEFLGFFLEDFCASNPRFAERFSEVDKAKQSKMLKASIILIFNSADNPFIRNNVAMLGQNHKKLGLNIEQHELDEWTESLLRTVGKFDPYFDENVEQAWRKTLERGLNIMSDECVVD
ncbi:globin [Vibrio mexicanus]|uniref:globin n=1 Tax=Vibrio mexicanus TaxID=1004326 RepID=UPI00063C325F|nr:globin [Vibrio mexicanus]